MFSRIAVSVLLISPAAGLAETVPYALAGSHFALEVDKTGLMRGKTHLFLFERLGGQLYYDAARPEKSRVELVIDAASIACKDTWVSENDLKKIQVHAEKEMLSVEQYPEIRFVSSAITPNGEGRYEVQGNLKIRDIARPVTVHVEMKPQGSRITFQGRAEVKMTAYKLKPPSAALGLIGTKDEMRVTFEVVAIPARRAETAARQEGGLPGAGPAPLQ